MPTALFTSIQEEVYTLTNRPDLVQDTVFAIKAATLKVHLVDEWDFDTTEEDVLVSQVDGLAQIDVATNLSLGARFRRVLYIQNNLTGQFLEQISAPNIFDSYSRLKTNVFYQIGTKINIRADDLGGSVLVAYLIAPITDPEQYNSWIAAKYPHIIATEAALKVLNSIGDTSIAKKLSEYTAEHIALLKINHLPNRA